MDCDKFEKLFIQETENELLEHIKTCETCNNEYKKMLATEKLVKEAKPYYFAKKRNNVYRSIAACFLVAVVSSAVFFNQDPGVHRLAYDDSVSNVFPVDEYGLLDIQ